MTPDERSLLERTASLAEENNKILRGIRRSNRVGMIMHALYWVLIIVMSFGAYYVIQPYFTALTGALGGTGGADSIQNAMQQAQNSATQLRDLLK